MDGGKTEERRAVKTGFGEACRKRKRTEDTEKPENQWQKKWAGLGHPYYGDMIRGDKPAEHPKHSTDQEQLRESQAKIIDLSEQRLAAKNSKRRDRFAKCKRPMLRKDSVGIWKGEPS